MKYMVQPVPRGDDVVGMMISSFHRIQPIVPDVSDAALDRLKEVTDKYCDLYLQPMDQLMSVEEYHCHLINTKGRAFADKMLKHHVNRLGDYPYLDDDISAHRATREANTFIKYEAYPSIKPVRLIQAMTPDFSESVDGFFLGLLIKSLEKVMYAGPCNVKNMSAGQKRALLVRLGFPLSVSDYSSFEASHTPAMIKATILRYYDFALKKLPQKHIYLEILEKYLTGAKVMIIRGYKVRLANSVEFSGDFSTALNNLMLNISVTLAVFLDLGCPVEEAVTRFVAEGDDNVNNAEELGMTPEMYARYGMVCKEYISGLSLTEAAFCQLYYTQSGQVMACYRKKMSSVFRVPQKYGESSAKVCKGLMRAQGLSLLKCHVGCPILQELALALLRLTSGVNVRQSLYSTLSYHEDVVSVMNLDWRKLANTVIEKESRATYELLFGVDIETQLVIEDRLKHWTGGVLELPVEPTQLQRDTYNNHVGVQPGLDYESGHAVRDGLLAWAKFFE